MATSRIWAWTKECSIKVVQNASHRIFENPWIESLNRCLEDLTCIGKHLWALFFQRQIAVFIGECSDKPTSMTSGPFQFVMVILTVPWLLKNLCSPWCSWNNMAPSQLPMVPWHKWHIQCFSALCKLTVLPQQLSNDSLVNPWCDSKRVGTLSYHTRDYAKEYSVQGFFAASKYKTPIKKNHVRAICM